MKILTKEEEQAHYNATLKGGVSGGAIGLGLGLAVAYAANYRFHAFRSLTLPMKTFLVTSSTTFASIVSADRASRHFEDARDPQRKYRDRASSDLEVVRQQESTFRRMKDWGRENRYPIVTASWIASMGIALGLVGRNPYLSKAQKLVQARVYAQGLTLAVLVATAAFEVGDANKGKGRWETVTIVDPNDPEHKHLIEKRIHHEAYAGEDLWRDMVATEERKIDQRNKAVKEQEEEDKKGKEEDNKPKEGDKKGKEEDNKPKEEDKKGKEDKKSKEEDKKPKEESKKSRDKEGKDKNSK